MKLLGQEKTTLPPDWSSLTVTLEPNRLTTVKKATTARRNLGVRCPRFLLRCLTRTRPDEDASFMLANIVDEPKAQK